MILDSDCFQIFVGILRAGLIRSNEPVSLFTFCEKRTGLIKSGELVKWLIYRLVIHCRFIHPGFVTLQVMSNLLSVGRVIFMASFPSFNAKELSHRPVSKKFKILEA